MDPLGSAFITAAELRALGFVLPEDVKDTAVAFRHRIGGLRRELEDGVETYVIDLWASKSGKRVEHDLPISRPVDKPVCSARPVRPIRRVVR